MSFRDSQVSRNDSQPADGLNRAADWPSDEQDKDADEVESTDINTTSAHNGRPKRTTTKGRERGVKTR